MKDKILEFLKGLHEKMGWKLWALVACAILGFIYGIPEGIGMALQGLIALPIGVVITYYIFLFIFKATKKTAKVAGKTAVAAGKGAVFMTAAGVAANKGQSISSAIKEGNRAVNKTKKLFGKGSDDFEDDDYEEEYMEETIASSPTKANNNSNEPKKTVRKVWRCTYIGTHNAAPKVLDVPSENASGRPSGNEFVSALKEMGYDDGMAHSIANGGSNACWQCE